jgi:hypothetical protein
MSHLGATVCCEASVSEPSGSEVFGDYGRELGVGGCRDAGRARVGVACEGMGGESKRGGCVRRY